MSEWQELLATARALPPMTPEAHDEQRLGFAYSNLACSTNHKPSIDAFWAVAQEYGWTKDRFAKWAAGRVWWER